MSYKTRISLGACVSSCLLEANPLRALGLKTVDSSEELVPRSRETLHGLPSPTGKAVELGGACPVIPAAAACLLVLTGVWSPGRHLPPNPSSNFGGMVHRITCEAVTRESLACHHTDDVDVSRPWRVSEPHVGFEFRPRPPLGNTASQTDSSETQKSRKRGCGAARIGSAWGWGMTV